MTDIIGRPDEAIIQNAPQKLHDSADGTFAPVSASAVPGVETALLLPALNAAFIDSAAGLTAGGKKTLVLLVSTALTWVTAGQATWQPFASRDPFVAAGGAASALTPAQVKLGAAVNLGGAGATSLPAGMYRLTAAAVAELANPDSLVGIELKFPSALNGGAALAYLESAT